MLVCSENAYRWEQMNTMCCRLSVESRKKCCATVKPNGEALLWKK